MASMPLELFCIHDPKTSSGVCMRKRNGLKKRTSICIACLSGIAIFGLLRYLLIDVTDVVDVALLMMGRFSYFLESPVFVIGILLYCSVVAAVLLYQTLRKEYNRYFLYFVFLNYLVILFSVVFLKSRGTKGFNMNILNVLDQIHYSPLSVLMNILLFSPLGLVFFLMIRKAKWVAFISIVFVCGCELIQYLFSLGVFDIVDIVLNLLGIYIGYLVGACTINNDRGK